MIDLLTLESGKSLLDLDNLSGGQMVDEALTTPGKILVGKGLVPRDAVRKTLWQSDKTRGSAADEGSIKEGRGDHGLGVDRRHGARCEVAECSEVAMATNCCSRRGRLD